MLRLVLSLVCIISYSFVSLAHSLDSFRFGCFSVYNDMKFGPFVWFFRCSFRLGNRYKEMVLSGRSGTGDMSPVNRRKAN